MYVLIGGNEEGIIPELRSSLDHQGIDHKTYSPDDISASEIKREDADGVFILGRDEDNNLDIFESIRDTVEPVFVRTLSDMESGDRPEPERILSDRRAVVNSVLNNIHSIEERKVCEGIADVVENTHGDVGIFIHDNPDPDAIASALAFETICDHYNVKSTTYYGGNISHPENVLFVEETDFRMESIGEEDVEDALNRSETIVFLDFAQPSVNNLLPEDVTPDIIIDHHYTNKGVQKGGLIQVRTDVGSTSTLMINHLLKLDIEISPMLASSLIYGIKTDTDDFIKNIYPADFKALAYVQKIADKELLSIFETAPLNQHTISALGTAISNREVKRDVLTTFIGKIDNRDDIPQIADFLTKERDVMVVLVFGEIDDKVDMSARCKDPEVHLGRKMERAFSDIGSAGGHKHSAGGNVPLSKIEGDTDDFISQRFREVLER